MDIILAKSPIILRKMPFSKPPKSDWQGGLVYITKKHLERCIIKNGARYYAIIGLISMMILNSFTIKLNLLIVRFLIIIIKT